MKILIDDVKLNLLLEQKKSFIGKKVAWDSILSASSFLLSAIFASYGDIWIIPGLAFKIVFLLIGCIFTAKAILDVLKSSKNSYSYQDLLKDINKCVWECLVPEKEVNRIEQVYTVSNRKYGEDGVVLRLISREKPFANAKQVDPVLEDLYLFYFREGE